VTGWWIGVAVATLSALLIAWLVPAWVTERVLRALEHSGRYVVNYRGRDIVPGLGVAWLVWVSGFAVLAAANNVVFPASGLFLSDSSWPIPPLPLLLVAGAFAFGLVDDALGDAGSRGFRGHLGALRGGRLTTGALKLFGIGALAMVMGAGAIFQAERSALLVPMLDQPGWAATAFAGAWALATLVIALSANFVNLTDLRPGRALKVYTLLAFLGVLATGWHLWYSGAGAWGLMGVSRPGPGTASWALAGALLLAVALLGPVAAVWRHDLGERAMLGDAGANAMGALAGYVLASNLPLWLLAVAAALLIALNLASERVSFSRVIEATPLLRWIDGLGRLPADRSDGGPGDGGAGNLVDKGDGREAVAVRSADPEQGKDGGS
jgi:hypothetical protein